MSSSGNIPQEWLDFVPCLQSGKHLPLLAKVAELRKQAKLHDAGKDIFPPQELIFRSLQLTLPQDIKVIMLGQDPYHGHGQAHGLCFSVPENTPAPPSLRNIFKEIHSDIYAKDTKHVFCHDLSYLAEQGVLLLNTVLTVQEGLAHSHAQLGWQGITQGILQAIAKKQSCAVLLWGKPAQENLWIFKNSPLEHCILTAPHPSPLSAHRGFLGCKHFSSANDWLIKQKKVPILW